MAEMDPKTCQDTLMVAVIMMIKKYVLYDEFVCTRI